jgi:hypothetical protein
LSAVLGERPGSDISASGRWGGRHILLPDASGFARQVNSGFQALVSTALESGIGPFLGYSPEGECAAQRKTIRCFRDYGLEATSEHSTGGRLDPFVGLQAMAWIYESPGARHRAQPLLRI